MYVVITDSRLVELGYRFCNAVISYVIAEVIANIDYRYVYVESNSRREMDPIL